MKPVSHESLEGWNEVVYAKDQPEYLPLPALKFEGIDPYGTVKTKWALTIRERVRVLWHGAVYLDLLTFTKPLTPTRIDVRPIV